MAWVTLPLAFLLAVFFGMRDARPSQVISTNAPAICFNSLHTFIGSLRPLLQTNLPPVFGERLIDEQAVRTIAAAHGISDRNLASLRIVIQPPNTQATIYQVGFSSKTFMTLSAPVQQYLESRLEGHTKGYLLAAITNKIPLSAVTDPDLRAFLQTEPSLRARALRKIASGSITNNPGSTLKNETKIAYVGGRWTTNETAEVSKKTTVTRWTVYILTDEAIAWRYTVFLNADGSVDQVFHQKEDAKEYDPKYEPIIKAVKEEARTELKKSGTYNGIGSVHSFWRLTKEKLKAKNIDWWSPAELNPNTQFD